MCSLWHTVTDREVKRCLSSPSLRPSLRPKLINAEASLGSDFQCELRAVLSLIKLQDRSVSLLHLAWPFFKASSPRCPSSDGAFSRLRVCSGPQPVVFIREQYQWGPVCRFYWTGFGMSQPVKTSWLTPAWIACPTPYISNAEDWVDGWLGRIDADRRHVFLKSWKWRRTELWRGSQNILESFHGVVSAARVKGAFIVKLVVRRLVIFQILLWIIMRGMHSTCPLSRTIVKIIKSTAVFSLATVFYQLGLFCACQTKV